MRAETDVAAEHVGDDDLGEVNVGDGGVAGVVEVLGEARVTATGDQQLRNGGAVVMGQWRREVGEEWVSELGPLGVPLEGVVGAADGEELVPVVFAREVT